MHTIRLRGPWRYRLASPAQRAEAAAQRPAALGQREPAVRLPAPFSAIAGAGFRGSAVLARRFNRPTGLESDDRVLLSIGPAAVAGRLWINDSFLGDIASDSAATYDITPRLQLSNELRVELIVDGDPEPTGSILGDVKLRIAAA